MASISETLRMRNLSSSTLQEASWLWPIRHASPAELAVFAMLEAVSRSHTRAEYILIEHFAENEIVLGGEKGSKEGGVHDGHGQIRRTYTQSQTRATCSPSQRHKLNTSYRNLSIASSLGCANVPVLFSGHCETSADACLLGVTYSYRDDECLSYPRSRSRSRCSSPRLPRYSPRSPARAVGPTPPPPPATAPTVLRFSRSSLNLFSMFRSSW